MVPILLIVNLFKIESYLFGYFTVIFKLSNVDIKFPMMR